MTVGVKELSWNTDFDGPWDEEASRRYRDGGYEGLSLTSRGQAIDDLGFLHDLEGLRSLRVSAPVAKDSAVFEIETLESLVLQTRGRSRIPDVSNPRLTDLVLIDRPGLVAGERWPNLRSLRIGRWKGTNLAVVDGCGSLEELYLEGMRQTVDLAGVEGCSRLARLILLDVAVTSTEPLSGLHELTEVRLLAGRAKQPHVEIDFAHLASDRVEKIWVINAGKVSGASALTSANRLSSVRLIDSVVSESQAEALESLPRPAEVDVVRPRPGA